MLAQEHCDFAQCHSTEPQLLAELWVLMQCKMMVSDVQNCNARSKKKKNPKMLSFSHFRPFLVCWRVLWCYLLTFVCLDALLWNSTKSFVHPDFLWLPDRHLEGKKKWFYLQNFEGGGNYHKA